ncbi:MAG: PIN domain-containing protein [Kiritimatiellia bacterium]|jgi:hypothetical protein|nr:PIN domain-containing protein [Kiritimatiellia bacterium]MDP6631771.1 PIN domain-containing protein [Kiritimatiellia bacterium]MDP6810475.1 PIN domain-containing protein [Kiritimatiellia bacterium]MDP7025007.1 PIN domain-containing protein [Kiritimatiellia bacterium]
MQTNYVLIDYENVQPQNLDLLAGHAFEVRVFVGAHQAKLTFELAEAMQRLGERAGYVRISGTGKNALDFHIAYYLGELATADPKAHFHIISKDRGFDPLIKHLKDRKIRIQRCVDLAEIPILRMASATTADEKLAAIVKNLAGRGQSRPRRPKTLANTITALFAEKPEDAEVTSLIKALEKRKLISITNGHVSYNLPPSSSPTRPAGYAGQERSRESGARRCS